MSIIITPVIEYVFQLAYPIGKSLGGTIGEILRGMVKV